MAAFNEMKDMPALNLLSQRWGTEELLQAQLGRDFLRAFGKRPHHIQVAMVQYIRGGNENEAYAQLEAWRNGVISN